MKSLIKAAVIASVLAVPALSFAQADAPLTRAQVEADLAQFKEHAPRAALGRDPYYPASTQAAEANIAAVDNGNTVAVGGASNDGSFASGSRDAVTPHAKSLYFGQ